MANTKDDDKERQIILEHMTVAHIERAVVEKQMTNRHIDRAVQQQTTDQSGGATQSGQTNSESNSTADKK